MAVNTLGIGIVGAGIIGDAHAGVISQLSDQRLIAIADPIESLRENLAAKYSVPKSCANWEQIVEDPDVDVVYIGTPNDLHMPIAVAAMESGKDVVCEKPLARSLAEGQAMLDEARETDRQLFIALGHRFAPHNQQAKKMLEDSAIGRPFLALSTFIGNEFARMDDPASWKGTKEKSGGGVVIDNGTHMIDLLRWWFGEAAAVTARCGRLAISAENKEEDTATLAIEFESGTLAELSLTFGARYSAWPKGYLGAAIRTEMYGLEGSIVVGGEGPAFRYVGRNSEAAMLEMSDIVTGLPSCLQTHFADCLRGKAKPLVTAEDGLAALKIVDAAYRSSKTGGRVLVDRLP